MFHINYISMCRVVYERRITVFSIVDIIQNTWFIAVAVKWNFASDGYCKNV